MRDVMEVQCKNDISWLACQCYMVGRMLHGSAMVVGSPAKATLAGSCIVLALAVW